MNDDPRTVSQQIEREIAGETLLDLFERNAREHPDLPALSWRDGDEWKTVTWGEQRERARALAMGLRGLGVGHRDCVAIMARNIPEHLLADAGAMHAAATPVSVYNTLAPEQIAHVVNDCGARVAILENRDVMKRWEEILPRCPRLEHLVLVEHAEDFRHLDQVRSFEQVESDGRASLQRDPAAAERAAAELRPEDPATIVYTSGTTGPPKGALITHRNVRWMQESIMRFIDPPIGASGLSYLPLAHVAERFTSYYIGIRAVGHGTMCPEITDAIEYARFARPTVFLGVPRVWEKVRAGIMAGIASEPSPVKRAIARRAIDYGMAAARLEKRYGAAAALPMAPLRALFDRLVYAKVRAQIGLDRARWILTGSAPCPEDVHLFFRAIGIPLLDTWGMTELTVVATINPPDAPRTDTVGVPLPGIEIRIAEDGEILARGGNVVAGYLNLPEQTAETFDADGWVHSGDLGAIDPDGHLRITGRKKELIITAGGKNISPNNLEAYLKEHPLIGQACVVGDGHKYLAALITIDAEAAPAFAKDHGIEYTDLASFVEHPTVADEIRRAVDATNERVSRVESIKRYVVLPTEWTPESGELTPTLKLKRPVVADRYAPQIEALYD